MPQMWDFISFFFKFQFILLVKSLQIEWCFCHDNFNFCDNTIREAADVITKIAGFVCGFV